MERRGVATEITMA
uniref:Uncharacterized protein n=1 Tax=Arundo donax TaxID=35708 RepID=A0A0A8XY25_ARUDO